MADNLEENSRGALEKALAELAEAFQPLTGNTELTEYAYYLYLLWGDLIVYPLEADETGGDEGEGGQSREVKVKKVITLENGRKIFDYGYCLATSPGEDYGSYCSGKIIETAQAMIAMLAERGAKKVGFTGTSLPAKRAAWIECLEKGIEVVNYMASEADQYASERILEMRKQAKQQQDRLEPRA